MSATRHLIGVAVLCAMALVVVPAAGAEPASPRIIGGTQVPITAAAWQVGVIASNPPSLCGGSIMDATHVLTGAHCVAPDGQTAPRPPADVTVIAGFSDTSAYVPGQPPPAGTQVVGAASIRVHPHYQLLPQNADDVAIITLARPLVLSGPNARAIGLAPIGATPAAGTPLRVTGYGQQDQARPPDGKLYAASLTAVDDDDCRRWLHGTSPVVLCAGAPQSHTCSGDSGSALTTTGPAPVVVGVVSFNPTVCTDGPGGFVDVTAPEIRAFIDGAAQIPIAPRMTAPPQLSSVRPPVQGSPLRCQPGAWSGSPSIQYTFKTDAVPTQILQSGGGDAYAPGGGDIGKQIVCVVAATNPGGVAIARTATAPPIQLDRVRPSSVIRSARCRRRTCRLVIQAVDPNSQGALRVRATARYRAAGRRRQRVRTLRIRQVDPRTYRATGTRFPRRRVRFTVRVTDAAGNRARTRVTSARSR